MIAHSRVRVDPGRSPERNTRRIARMQNEQKLAAAQDQPVDAMIPPEIRHDRQQRGGWSLRERPR